MAAQLISTKGFAARRERWWTARASSSLPVPVSPVMSTVASVAATCSIASNVRRIASEPPTISWKNGACPMCTTGVPSSPARRARRTSICSRSRARAIATPTGAREIGQQTRLAFREPAGAPPGKDSQPDEGVTEKRWNGGV
jgi:hypothetical protein